MAGLVACVFGLVARPGLDGCVDEADQPGDRRGARHPDPRRGRARRAGRAAGRQDRDRQPDRRVHPSRPGGVRRLADRAADGAVELDHPRVVLVERHSSAEKSVAHDPSFVRSPRIRRPSCGCGARRSPGERQHAVSERCRKRCGDRPVRAAGDPAGLRDLPERPRVRLRLRDLSRGGPCVSARPLAVPAAESQVLSRQHSFVYPAPMALLFVPFALLPCRSGRSSGGVPHRLRRRDDAAAAGARLAAVLDRLPVSPGRVRDPPGHR